MGFEDIVEAVEQEQILTENALEENIKSYNPNSTTITLQYLIEEISKLEDRSKRHLKIQELVLRMRGLGTVGAKEHNQKIKELRAQIDEEARKLQAMRAQKSSIVMECHDGMYCDSPNGVGQITNFIIYPNYRVYTDKVSTNDRISTDTYAEFTIIIPQEEDHSIQSTVELKSYDFRSSLALKEELHKHNVGSAFIHGTDRMVSKLGEYLFTEVKCEKKKGVSLLGIVEVEKEKVVVTPGHTYDLEGNIRPDIVYHRDATTPLNVITKLTGLEYEPDSWKTEVLPLFIQNVVYLHERATMLSLIGWLTAIGFETIIRTKGNTEGFSHAFLVGVNGGGKSAIAATLMPYFGYGSEASLPSFTTSFGDLSSVSSSYHIPTVKDEYRPSEWGEKERNTRNNFIRDTFGKKSEDKGTKYMEVNTYPCKNPLLITGQQAPSDPSLLERMIMIYTNSNFINEEVLTVEGQRARDVHELLNDSPNKNYWTGFLIWAAKRNPDDVINIWKEYIDKLKSKFPKMKIREAKNYAIVPLGLYMFKQLAEEYNLDCGYTDQDIEHNISTLGDQVTTVLGEKKDELRLLFEDLNWFIETHENTHGKLFGDDYSVRLYQPSDSKADEYGKDKKPAFVRGRKVLLINIADAVKTIGDRCKNKHHEQMLKPIIANEFEKTKKNNGTGLVLAPDGYRATAAKRYTAFNWELVKEYFSYIEKQTEEVKGVKE
ncbi:hypothetical protein [Paenibacillus odorifer]|uniref:hypothetical protein n=1 Tax=Paenibacillus odorifer TaxID=189426 RepID=UPI00096EF827|nr:hypothetical protein [Paenibacillus odorifer]OMD61034.1 hypothetical protein BSK55_06755 [Paenibacillus odorifer]